jgi:hypothetical protein
MEFFSMMQTKLQPLLIPAKDQPTSSEEAAQTPSSYSSNVGSLITPTTYARDITKNKGFVKPEVHTPPPPEFFTFNKRIKRMKYDYHNSSDSSSYEGEDELELYSHSPATLFSQTQHTIFSNTDDTKYTVASPPFQINRFIFGDADYNTSDSEENNLLAGLTLSPSPPL